jgi:hypothetical protein
MTNSKSTIAALLRRLRAPALAALGGATAVFGQTLVGNSPFMPPANAVGAAGAPAAAYELAGSTAQGSEVTVCIYEREAKRSLWIGVGETSGGVQVVSYDAANDTAVVTIDGVRRDLAMRKAAVVAQSQSPGYRSEPSGSSRAEPVVASAPPAPASPDNVAQDQREARMLVSDLLEIGVQQRKAYQEAKQKAAEASTQPAN